MQAEQTAQKLEDGGGPDLQLGSSGIQETQKWRESPQEWRESPQEGQLERGLPLLFFPFLLWVLLTLPSLSLLLSSSQALFLFLSFTLSTSPFSLSGSLFLSLLPSDALQP